MILIKVIQDSGLFDISNYSTSCSLSDNIDSLGRELTFDYNNNKYVDKCSTWIDLKCGMTVVVYHDGTQIYQGQIVNIDQSDLQSYSIKCVDNAFYLNKNQTVIQFKDITVKQAIEQLCAKENIPCQVACDINTKVTKIYNGEVISKIIDDLLTLDTNETNIKYRREYNYGSLYINAYNNLKMIYDKEPIIGSMSVKNSIENLANKVVIVSSSEKNTTVKATVQDDNSIQTYGQWTHYEKVDDKKIANATAIANAKLKELNKVQKDISLTLWGDDYVRSGRILKFNQEWLTGSFLVTNCTHSYVGNEHTMNVDLKECDSSDNV